MTEIKGRVHSFESFALVDGPGVRYCIFLQGCHMRCKFCHNPDTWKLDGGQEWTAKDLFDKVYRYKTYWKDNGGITVSGGEPLLQVDFLKEFFSLAKAKKVSTCIDTAGQPFPLELEQVNKLDAMENVEAYLKGEKEFSMEFAVEVGISDKNWKWLTDFYALMQKTDLFLLDLKEPNPVLHKELTGWDNCNIFALAQFLSDHGKHMWIRHVLVPGVTDDPDGLKYLGLFAQGLKTVDRVEILPYHTLGKFKWENLGIDYPLENVATPSAEEVRTAEELIGVKK